MPRRHPIALLALPALLYAAAAPAQVRFAVTDLGTLGGATSLAFAIGDDGTVVGESLLASGGRRAFSFADGLMRNLDPLGHGAFNDSGARALDGQGQVAGFRTDQAARFAARTVTELGNFGGASALATGIDADGVVVGKAQDALGRWQAFRQRGDGPLVTLSTLGTQAAAEAVNAGGTVVGWSQIGGVIHPVQWSADGAMSLLDFPFAAGYFAQALAINGQGRIVGRRDDGLGSGGAHAVVFHWPGNVQVIPGDVGAPGIDATSVARGINDAGQVVGQASLSFAGAPDPYSSSAFVWAGGERIALDQRLAADPGFAIVDATGINRWGQIAANGSNGHALLLTPTGTLVWRGPGGGRFGDAAAWDSGDLGLAPNRFLSARIDADSATVVTLEGQAELQVLTLGRSSAPGTVQLRLEAGAALRLQRLEIGAGGELRGGGTVLGELRHDGRIAVRGDERLVLAGAVEQHGRIEAGDAAVVVYRGDVTATGRFVTTGDGRHRFEGLLRPGDGAGVLELGATDLAGVLSLRIDGLAAGQGHDRLSFEGLLRFEPGAAFELRWQDGFAAAAGDRFDLFDFAFAPEGRPAQMRLPALPGGLVWRHEALFVTGEIGIAAVPEPAAGASLLLGLALLALWARRGVRAR